MKQKKENKKTIIIVSVIIIFIVGIIILITLGNNEDVTNTFKREGYTTEEESTFYSKITTNNTLDEYYDDIAKGKDSLYEEYYFSKNYTSFIQVKMSHNSDVDTTLNINSNLKSGEVTYNYELAYKDVHLIIEGNNSDGYVCRPVIKENISDENINTYCGMIQEEISIYTKRKDELLQNKKIQELINKPIEEVKEK